MIKSSGMTVTPVSTAMTSPTIPNLLQQQKTSRISNFSVDSLLADTRPSSVASSPASPASTTLSPSITTTLTSPINLKHQSLINTATNQTENSLAHNSITPLAIASFQQRVLLHHQSRHQLNDSSSTTSSTTKNERNTPHSSASAESDIEYDSNADDDDNSIVDIEDVRNENSMTPPNSGEIEKSRQMLMATQAALSGHVPIRPTPFSALAAAAFHGIGAASGIPWPGARQMPTFPPGMFPGQGFGAGHHGQDGNEVPRIKCNLRKHKPNRKPRTPFTTVMDDQIFTDNKKRRKLRQDVINFILPVLATRKEEGYFPQDNYREILELALLLMGHPMPNYVIKKPGACHKARWMAPAIYALKIYLLRGSMNLSDAEEDNLKEFCLFVCLVYVKSWTQCQIPSMAPENTLQLYKELYNYASLNATISEQGITKFKEHLWYIGHEMIFLSLFSSSVKPKDKQNIFEQMVLKDNGWTERNLKLNNIVGLHKKKLHQLVGPSSLSALQALRVDIQFMYDFDADKWGELEEYKKAKEVVDSLKVVNDCAERCLKIITDVNGKLTKSETGTQQLIQVVQDSRNRISSTKKSVLSSYQRR